MRSEMLSLLEAVFFLSLLTGGKCRFEINVGKINNGRCNIHCPGVHASLISGCGQVDSICRTRRCLAEMLINKNLTSQPQYENCTLTIYMPFMEYQTLSVVSMHLINAVF